MRDANHSSTATRKRVYAVQQYCPVARTMDVLGDRWTILVIRDIFRKNRRFSQLVESLPGISPNLLSNRLKKLEERGILERRGYSDHPPRAEYRFTEKGLAFGKVIGAMAEWGEAWEPEDASA